MTLNAFFLFTLFMVLVALWEGGLGCDMEEFFNLYFGLFIPFFLKKKKQ